MIPGENAQGTMRSSWLVWRVGEIDGICSGCSVEHRVIHMDDTGSIVSGLPAHAPYLVFNL